MIKSNFHTHTYYCDGKNSPEEIIKTAILKGFDAIGFSGHSYFEQDKDYCMSVPNQRKYIDEISELKIKYKDKISIFCGIEQDYYSPSPEFDYDYIIGSVHVILKDGKFLNVDVSAESLKDAIDSHFDGEFDLFAEDYFKHVSEVVEKTNADIVGHIDLVSKFSETLGFGQSKKFLECAEKTVKKLAKFNIPFEINTGAMSRGARSVPYPSPEILEMIKNEGGGIMFSSDCHDEKYLDYGFDDAIKLAKGIGFTEHAVITKDGIKYKKI